MPIDEMRFGRGADAARRRGGAATREKARRGPVVDSYCRVRDIRRELEEDARGRERRCKW